MTAVGAVPHRVVEHCMGTVFTIDVRSPGVDGRAVAAAIAWLHHVDEVFSTYRPHSSVSRLRDGRLRRAEAPEEVRAVLRRCEELERETGGAFSAYPDGVLDPSGYVKGWAIERASDLLAAAGSPNHCVNGGGDVQCRGSSVPGLPWTVGIADPSRPGAVLAQVQGAGHFAVATSGTAERGGHIRDPRTGAVADHLLSVTVIGEHLAEVDALATAAFATGADAAGWLTRRGLRGLVVDRDGSVVVTPDQDLNAQPAASPPTAELPR